MTDYPIKSPRRRFEVALPLDAINVACAREKSIRHERMLSVVSARGFPNTHGFSFGSEVEYAALLASAAYFVRILLLIFMVESQPAS